MKPLRFEDYVPHSHPMALLDVIDYCDDESLQASVVIRSDAPFAEAEGVPSYVGIEYMAQSIGAFAGVCARQQQQPIKIGFLVGSRRYNCNCSYFPIGATLKVSVKREIEGENGLSVFECQISGDNISANANLNVFQPDNPAEFLGD